MMRVSLNEIQSIIFKSCIAVGLPMGIGQDASQAAGFIYPQYKDSIKPFVDAISALDRECSDKFNISQAVEGSFSSIVTSKQLSSLYTAPSVCDQILIRNKNNQSHSAITLANLDVPVIIIFEIMFITMFINSKVRIIWQLDQGDAMKGTCEGGNLTFSRGSHKDLFSLRNSTLRIFIPNYISSLICFHRENMDLSPNLDIDNATWERLSEYAERLLVPSSDVSRMMGAGAGTLDTD